MCHNLPRLMLRCLWALFVFTGVFTLLRYLPGFNPSQARSVSAAALSAPILQTDMPTDCAICAFKTEWWELQELVPRAVPTIPSADSSPLVGANESDDVIDWMRVAYQVPYVDLTSSVWQIYYHNWAEPGYLIPLTSQGSNTQPRLSRDTEQIVFMSNRDRDDRGKKNREIYRIRYDGSGETRLTYQSGTDTMPAWSPDMQQIVFASERDGNYELYVMNADGANPQRLTTNAEDDLYPTWSRDGTIAWVRVQGEFGSLMLMDRNGANQRTVRTGLRFLARPNWAPDGQSLAVDFDNNQDGLNEPYLISRDGSRLDLIPTPDLGLVEWWIGSWEPNQRSLVLTAQEYGIDDGEFVLNYSRMVSVCMIPESYNCRNVAPTFQTYAGSPDVQSVDSIPPTVELQTVRAYTQNGDPAARIRVADAGGSSRTKIDTQVRLQGMTDWSLPANLRSDGEATWLFLTPQSNDEFGTYEYRVRVEDQAGNRSTWSAPQSTFLYDKTATGQVVDNRGVPLTDVQVPFDPEPLTHQPTDSQGRYRALYGGNFSVEKPTIKIYGVPQTTVEPMYHQDAYLRSTTNLLANGDFEALTLGSTWEPLGTLTPTLQSTLVAAGAQALRLGSLCDGACAVVGSPSPTLGEPNFLAVDDTETVHLLTVLNNRRLVYYRRAQGEAWDSGVTLYSTSGNEISYVSGALNHTGGFMAVWSVGRQYDPPPSIYLRERSATGQWSEGTMAANGFEPIVRLTNSGIWHLFSTKCTDPPDYSCSASRAVEHRYELATHNVSAPQQLFTSALQAFELPKYAVAVTDDERVHLVYGEPLQASDFQNEIAVLRYRIFQHSNGTWSAPTSIPTNRGLGCETMYADRQNTLHLLCNSGTYLYYLRHPSNSNWRLPEPTFVVPYSYGGYMSAMGNDDTLYVFPAPDIQSGYQFPGFFKSLPDGSWSNFRPVNNVGNQFPGGMPSLYGVAVGSVPHVISLEAGQVYQAVATASVAGQSRIQQQLTIPTAVKHPTLAFFYALYDGKPTNQSQFQLTVSTAMTTTQLFTTSLETDWRFKWVDMEPWQGETVTVTFAVEQAANEPYLQLYLDDVTLGPWTTPVATAVTPAHIEAGAVQQVTIQGANLTANTNIQMGEVNLSPTGSAGDGNTLTFSLPSPMQPGTYPIYLRAAADAPRVYAGTIYVGKQTFLPIIAR